MSINGDGMLFSAPMVRALLDGRKTQTRRPLYGIYKIRNGKVPASIMHDRRYPPPQTGADEYADLRYVIPAGDRIWVRETWRTFCHWDHLKPSDIKPGNAPHDIRYEAGPDRENFHMAAGKLRPSIFLPRWASRLTLPVTAVRIERLQDISEEDAEAEGCVWDSADGHPIWYVPGVNTGRHWPTAREMYAALWDHINGPGSWDRNEWVIAYTFDVIKANIDAPAPASV